MSWIYCIVCWVFGYFSVKSDVSELEDKQKDSAETSLWVGFKLAVFPLSIILYIVIFLLSILGNLIIRKSVKYSEKDIDKVREDVHNSMYRFANLLIETGLKDKLK